MAIQNKTTLKGHFETGDVPNQTQYGHLIDSQLNLAETGTIIAAGTISASSFIAENHMTSSGNGKYTYNRKFRGRWNNNSRKYYSRSFNSNNSRHRSRCY